VTGEVKLSSYRGKKVEVLKETKGKRSLLVVVVVTSEVKRGRLIA
jgi:hypothetical protein